MTIYHFLYSIHQKSISQSREEDYTSVWTLGDVNNPGPLLWLPADAAAKSHQSCPTLCDPIDGSPPAPRPWDSPGKNTGVGCHFLLQCMKVKSESEVTQSCPNLRNTMDCSLPASSVQGIFQARVLEWVAVAFSILAAYHMKKTN